MTVDIATALAAILRSQGVTITPQTTAGEILAAVEVIRRARRLARRTR